MDVVSDLSFFSLDNIFLTINLFAMVKLAATRRLLIEKTGSVCVCVHYMADRFDRFLTKVALFHYIFYVATVKIRHEIDSFANSTVQEIFRERSLHGLFVAKRLISCVIHTSCFEDSPCNCKFIIFHVIRENSIDGVLDATFSVEHSSFGVLKNHELKPGGKDISVTEENKREYVRLYVNYRFMRGIEQQFLALQKGFHELIPPLLLRPFDERELELVIGGLGTIDINDWKMHTRLKHCTPDTPVVQWFWQIVESYGEEMRARLLQFVTGSSRVPLQGFKALQGKFLTIRYTNAVIALISTHARAHTRMCF